MCVGFCSHRTITKEKNTLASVKKVEILYTPIFCFCNLVRICEIFRAKRQLKELFIIGYAREIRWPDEGSLSKNKGVCYLTKKCRPPNFLDGIFELW